MAKAQRVLSRRTKGSTPWNKQQVKVDRIHEYISNARKDYLDKISTEISKNHERYREFASINLKNEAIRFLNEVKEGEFNVYAYSLRDDKIKKYVIIMRNLAFIVIATSCLYTTLMATCCNEYSYKIKSLNPLVHKELILTSFINE